MTVAPPTPADPEIVHVEGGSTVKANVFVTPLAVAVRVAICAEVTAAAVAVNAALDDPDGIVTLAGTVTLALLLDIATATALVGATVSETVQETDAGPVTVADVQVTPLSDDVVCATEIDPPVPAVETEEPAGLEITTGLTETTIEESGAFEAMFNVAAAMVPLPMAFWFRPYATHFVFPELLEQDRLFPAALKDAPAATLTLAMSELE